MKTRNRPAPKCRSLCTVYRRSTLTPLQAGPVLPHFKEYVTCMVHKAKILDLCYGNIRGAYISRPIPGLSRSAHTMV